MLTIFKLNETQSLSPGEDQYVRMMLDRISKLNGFSWLNDLNLDRIRFCYAVKLQVEDGICGAFSVLHPNTIFLLDMSSGFHYGKRPFTLEYQFPIIIHELRHCWQFHKHPIGFIYGSIPLIREWTIERDALKQEKAAQEFTSKFIEEQDQKYFARKEKS